MPEARDGEAGGCCGCLVAWVIFVLAVGAVDWMADLKARVERIEQKVGATKDSGK